jgi:hypothetical protein
MVEVVAVVGEEEVAVAGLEEREEPSRLTIFIRQYLVCIEIRRKSHSKMPTSIE